ncbi:Hch1 protein [Martiniozyma asiatica (nom. inval.)]|nr:Hch1 protein [Martiniozyma asiatica]
MSNVVVNPNNWHWVDKNALPWAKDYLTEKLCAVVHTAAGKQFKIKEVKSISGDCDVTQRKGKVRCIFELKVEIVALIIEDEDEKEVIIILPEFEHDYDEDDFRFEYKGDVGARGFIKKELTPKIIEQFLTFQPALLKEHEVELKHNV